MKKFSVLFLMLALMCACCSANAQTVTVGPLTLDVPDTVTVESNGMSSSDGYAVMSVKKTQYPINEYLSMYYAEGEDVTLEDIEALAEEELQYISYGFFNNTSLTMKSFLGATFVPEREYDLAVWRYEVEPFGGYEQYVDSVYITQVVCVNTVNFNENYEFNIYGLTRESVEELEGVFDLSRAAVYANTAAAVANTALPETQIDMYSFVKAYYDLIPLAFSGDTEKMIAHDLDYGWLFNYMQYGDASEIAEHVDSDYGVTFYSGAVRTSLVFGIKDTQQAALTAVIAEGDEDVDARIRMLSALLDAYFREGDIGDWLSEVRTAEGSGVANTRTTEVTYEGYSVKVTYRKGNTSAGIVRIIAVELL